MHQVAQVRTGHSLDCRTTCARKPVREKRDGHVLHAVDTIQESVLDVVSTKGVLRFRCAAQVRAHTFATVCTLAAFIQPLLFRFPRFSK